MHAPQRSRSICRVSGVRGQVKSGVPAAPDLPRVSGPCSRPRPKMVGWGEAGLRLRSGDTGRLRALRCAGGAVGGLLSLVSVRPSQGHRSPRTQHRAAQSLEPAGHGPAASPPSSATE